MMMEKKKRLIVKNCYRVKEKVLSLNPCTSLTFPFEENGKSEEEIYGIDSHFLEHHFRNFHMLRDGQCCSPFTSPRLYIIKWHRVAQTFRQKNVNL